MKGFLKSKFGMMLIAFILLASAVAVPLIGTLGRTHAANPIPIPFSNINGSFFTNPNDSGTFDVNPSTPPVFKQTFPIIYFNPPTDMQSCSNNTGVDDSTRPFTDVSPNQDGTCTTIPAQDNNGDQAGVGNLFSFEAVYLANVTVPSAGQLSTTVFADDGWIVSMGPDSNGHRPTPDPGNIMTNPPPGQKGPFTGYPEMGDNNVPSSPTAFTIIENFPAAGTYPVEIDYTECCGGTLSLLATNTFSPTPPPKHQKLFVLLQGIDTALTKDEASANGGLGMIPDFWNTKHNVPGIVPFLQSNYPDAKFLAFSYGGSNPFNGHPFQYDCLDTFVFHIDFDALALSVQIAGYLSTLPKDTITDIYLVGHSLGGAVALAYLTALLEAPNAVIPLPANGHLAGVVTLDSPVGGVSSYKSFQDFVFSFFQEKALGLLGCQGLTDKNSQFNSVKDLAHLFDTTSKPTFPPSDDGHPGAQGAHASILEAVFHGQALTNQGLVEEAAAKGISVLTIGNSIDYLYNPGVCPFGPSVHFITAQWIGDEGPEDAAKEHNAPLTVYGRKFTAGSGCIQSGLLNLINHKEIYNNTDVETGLLQFVMGNAPIALKVAPPEP